MRPGILAATASMAALAAFAQVNRCLAQPERAAAGRPLADEFVTVYRSPSPQDIFCYSPGLALAQSHRLVATFDLGGAGVQRLPGPKAAQGDFGLPSQGKIYTSDDGGQRWVHRGDFPFLHARPFAAGQSLYVLGHAGDLTITRSDDLGQTWSPAVALTRGEHWHQAPCNVHYANGCVYLVMEKRVRSEVKGWPVSELAPVLMRARIGTDLTRRESWTFASELSFADAVATEDLEHFGIPFFRTLPKAQVPVAPGRTMSPIGWLEANVVQFLDPDHVWFDPKGRTFHLWMRAHTGTTGLAAVAKVVEEDDGRMTTQLERAPSGETMVFVPCPGGQMKFHLLFDPSSACYWLLSSQATDSLTRPDRLSPDRYGLPNNERHRLQLHFSRNGLDWCFAGIVAMGSSPRQARHYASMAIDGEDLVVLSRSGDEDAASAHNGNLITFHRIRSFRRLIY